MSDSKTTAEDAVYRIVVSSSAADIWQIAGDAMQDKELLFKEYGWDVNHKINEGDVKCVLRAIMRLAQAKLTESEVTP